MVRRCTSSKTLSGKTAVVTGANAGLGYQTALEFAKRRCRVIMACRSEAKATAARDKIISATGNEDVVVRVVDLASMESVRQFAADIIDTEDNLHLLINNAGAIGIANEMTSEGLLLAMATNYYSHFLLTCLLLDLLKKSAPSRIVNLSSSSAKWVRSLNVDELNKPEGKFKNYGKTKLCNILFTQELGRRLQGTGVTTYSVHPGGVHTEAQVKLSKLLDFMSKLYQMTPEEGVQTTLYVSLEDNIEHYNGRHFENCKVVQDYRGARDPQKAKKLWEVSETLLGLK